MFQLLMFVHFAVCIFLIGVVLIQQGKGADAGATFGGSSNTVFGASGASTILTKATTAGAVLFIVTALLLVKMYPESLGGTPDVAADPLSGSVMTVPVHPGEDTTKEAPTAGEPVASTATGTTDTSAIGSEPTQADVAVDKTAPADVGSKQ